jgi:hypothetical protein
MEDMHGQVPLQYTQPEAAGSFDQSYQKSIATPQALHTQLRTPNYNQKQQVHFYTHIHLLSSGQQFQKTKTCTNKCHNT